MFWSTCFPKGRPPITEHIAHIQLMIRLHSLTWATWSCRRRASSNECSPSAPDPSRRSCRRCGRSWRSRSWWRPCRGSGVQWGRIHTTAPGAPPPWGLERGWRLQYTRGVILIGTLNTTVFFFFLILFFPYAFLFESGYPFWETAQTRRKTIVDIRFIFRQLTIFTKNNSKLLMPNYALWLEIQCKCPLSQRLKRKHVTNPSGTENDRFAPDLLWRLFFTPLIFKWVDLMMPHWLTKHLSDS